ncbi:MAG TPA: hypothetical protein VET89_05145 [Stellaceae bacterium]|nr:hypothetical protein [Stellaceae bacterium]
MKNPANVIASRGRAERPVAGVAPARSRWRPDAGTAILFWLIPAALYYAFLLSAGSPGLFAPVNFGLTFNSMLLHMLQGRFDVDPAAIGPEGYLRDGSVYAYFGVFPALFRAAFLWLPGFARTDFTRIACLVAVVAMALFKLMSVRLMWRRAGAQASSSLLALLAAAILVSGPQIEFLRPSIYQEVELWAGAMAAAFVYLFLRGLNQGGGFTSRLLAAMAAAAGLALLTRVSMALGLYVAVGAIWLGEAWRASRARQWPIGLVAPAVILAGFVGVTALINFERWGNPLVFADFTKSLILDQYPDRLARLQRYGEFNLARIGYGIGYYFAPFWALRDGAGQLLWSGFEDGFADCCVELPPGSFLVSDPLLIGLGVFGLAHAFRKGVERRDLLLAAALGLAVPWLLMLTAFAMSFRYRIEFYPLIELFAFLGFARLAARPTARATAPVALGAFAGIVTAHAFWLLYMLSPFGPAGQRMGAQGIVELYASLFR